ncbi:acyl-CoA thioesterase [Phytohabitans houttuyneae]|uniref:Thioesterase n=1 Tax=Phytohabitans houttuyneae TaxID=1076126 RepID=A0A6V8KVE3_9ACTN|nr:acyl-CoA thioesterase [Phytohabitans houttuyneae]GFJ84545.1 thioesterase [Phytohabitans houttuyneae]
MGELFHVRVGVRGYELDIQGHLNQAVYLQYAEHARWEHLRAAGITPQKMQAARRGPVVLETTIRYLSELRAGDEVDISCAFEWGGGKTFRLRQELRKTDGTLASEITAVGGVLDLDARRLVADPAAELTKLADHPEVLDAS